MNKIYPTVAVVMTSALLCVALAGCAADPPLIHSPDPELKHTPGQFAADAVKRHPYRADAPRIGQAVARAEIAYGARQVRLVNCSDEDWKDVEIWVNRQYCCYLPTLPRLQLKVLDFQMLYDDNGNYLPMNVDTSPVEKLEIYRDGKMYNVAIALPN